MAAAPDLHGSCAAAAQAGSDSGTAAPYLGSAPQGRIQVGLLALSEIHGGPAQAVQRRLGELRARVKAIEELSQLESPSVPPAQEATP